MERCSGPQKNILHENIWELCLGCVLDCSSSPSAERSDSNLGKKTGTTSPFQEQQRLFNKHKMYSSGLFGMGRHGTGANMWRHIVVCDWKKEHTGSHIPGCAAYLDTLWDGLIGWQSFKGKPGALSGKSLPSSLWYKGLNSGELWVASLFSPFFYMVN